MADIASGGTCLICCGLIAPIADGGSAPSCLGSKPLIAAAGSALTSAAVALANAFGGSPPIVSEFISAGSIFFPPGPSIAIF